MPDEGGKPLRFVASTDNVARDGLVIDAKGWNLDNYRKNPVVLWAHDYSGARPPIGRAEVFMDENRLMADVTFDQSDDFARSVETKYRTGFLHSVSVGWDSQEIKPSEVEGVRGIVTRADLLDISAVPVPGDPNALIARQARALADLADTETVSQADWIDTAAAMVDLYRSVASGAETEFPARYRTLARQYERMNRTPPEIVAPSTLRLLDAATIRGLFLEGEADLFPHSFSDRAGAVLSRQNLADLADAVSLIQRVIERGSKPEETERAAEPTPDVPADDTLARILNAIGG